MINLFIETRLEWCASTEKHTVVGISTKSFSTVRSQTWNDNVECVLRTCRNGSLVGDGPVRQIRGLDRTELYKNIEPARV